jgi:protein-L-isoaspartate(D-aspartate) O-methyltransferase
VSPIRRAGPDFKARRAAMVAEQLRARGIEDERVLEAMAAVPRERFVSEREQRRAYADRALAIGEGQTISQPWIVAAICQALRLEGPERVLEVGTGSGYSAAVLARLAREVVSLERIEELAGRARTVLDELATDNVEIVVGDGSRGAAERGPFDAIAVHAATPEPPRSLLEQLRPGGRLVIPVATDKVDLLTVFEAGEDGLRSGVIGPCRFVRLIGEEGFDA